MVNTKSDGSTSISSASHSVLFVYTIVNILYSRIHDELLIIVFGNLRSWGGGGGA